AYALIYPFLDFSALRSVAEGTTMTVPLDTLLVFPSATPSSTAMNILNLLLCALGLVSVFFGIRFALRLRGIYRVHRHSTIAQWQTYSYREVGFSTLPFTFFKQIYV